MDGEWLITPGAVVRLKSGGAWWTVESVEGDTAECIRLYSGYLYRQKFKRAALERWQDVSWWRR